MPDTAVRPQRNSVILYAAVARADEAPVECRVRNLSSTGACIDDTAALVVGERVTVAMGTLRPVVGEVMWVERRLAGLRFDRVIDLAAARQPRRAAAAATRSGWLGGIADPYLRQR